MKTLRYPFLSVIISSFAMLSCSSGSEDVEYSDLCYISSFSLGTMRLKHTAKESQGRDSTYYTAFSAARYSMSIDQRTNTIENTRPLPYNAVLDKVLTSCSFETALFHRPKDISGLEPADTLWEPYSKKDSIDFTKPREFLVLSADGLSTRRYTVRLNVSEMNPAATVWDSLGVCEQIKDLPSQERRLAVQGGNVILLSQQESEISGEGKSMLRCFSRAINQENGWQENAVSGADGAVLETLQRQGGMLYLSTQEGRILYSADGQNWRTRMLGLPGLRLVGVSEKCVYAIVDGKLMGTSLDMENWQEQTLDDETRLLPEKDITTIILTQQSGSKRLLMIGKSADGQSARLWAKLLGDKGADECAIGWSYYTENAAITHPFPLLRQSNVLCYDKGVLVFGGAPNCGEGKALGTLYYSQDCGITWTGHEDMSFDQRMTDAAKDATFITAADEDGRHIWVLIDGQLWRGRLNRVAFSD